MPDRAVIVFDLDGTLSDPSEGVINAFNYALKELGRPERPGAVLTRYIGPPLKVAFSELLETKDEALVAEGVALFRRYYRAAGFRENRLYEGIEELLKALKEAGHNLYVVTIKIEEMANRVLRIFGIAGYFEGIYGCDFHIPKAGALKKILEKETSVNGNAFMVGDRETDIAAGRQVGMRTIGVSWGFGPLSELRGAEAVVRTPSELLRYLENPDGGLDPIRKNPG
jgi:phosphoglycolate phosphatase